MGMLCSQGTCVNLNTMDRVSPLHGACIQGHAACAKLLMENGANVSKKKRSSDHGFSLVAKCEMIPNEERLFCDVF